MERVLAPGRWPELPGRGPRVIRVASVPADHPYVRQLAGPGYRVLPDPPVPGAPAGQWWPPVALDADWVRRHAGDFDLMHVHFGTEGRSVEQLEALVAALREVGRPLVFTAHDLDHPHLADQGPYRAQLEVLVPSADAVLTLTGHAADRILADHGVRALVVPHPRLAPDAWFERADAVRLARSAAAPIVAVHLREMRANVRPEAWLAALASAVGEVGGATLRLYVNASAGGRGPAGEALDRTLASIDGRTHVEVLRRPRPGDDALALELASADVSVLPYAHGTHSGWLELCWDLGTKVLTPDVGALAHQHREPWFLRAFPPEHAAETIGAELRALLGSDGRPSAGERLLARRAQAEANTATHRSTYERLVGAGPVITAEGGRPA